MNLRTCFSNSHETELTENLNMQAKYIRISLVISFIATHMQIKQVKMDSTFKPDVASGKKWQIRQ